MFAFNIHRVNTKDRRLKKLSHYEMIVHIVNEIEDSKDAHLSVNTLTMDSIDYYLFSKTVEETRSKWESFLPNELKKNINFDLTSVNYLLFASYEHALFVIVGGRFFHNIVGYLEKDFGISMVSKLLDPSKDSILSIDTRGISGDTARSSELYKNEFRLINYVKFGKIPTSLIIVLNQDTSTLYFSHLLTKKNEKIKVEASRGFKLKKKMNFEHLHATFLEFTTILSLGESDFLSTYEEIKKKRFIDQNLKSQLIKGLYDAANNMVSSKPVYSDFKFDFIHPSNHLAFISSDSYIIKEKTDNNGYKEFASTEDFNMIPRIVFRAAAVTYSFTDLFDFMVWLQGVRIYSYKSESDKSTTTSPFLYFINSEFLYKMRPYFYLDNSWYLLKDSFLQDLNDSSKRLLTEKKLPDGILYKGWDRVTQPKEAKYNYSYAEEENYIVFDTIVKQNIELCDVMHIDKNDVYLIHVKKGFNAELRSLASQVSIAANRLKTDRDSGNYDFLKETFSATINPSMTKEVFIDALQKKRIHFVFAFTNSPSLDFMIEDNLEKMQSNIAKYSLIECNTNLIQIGYSIYFKQILKFDEMMY